MRILSLKWGAIVAPLLFLALVASMTAGAPASSAQATSPPSVTTQVALTDAMPPSWCYQPVHEETTPAPPPYVCDRSGSDQDEFFVPALPDVYYSVEDGSVGYDDGFNSTGGAPQVKVRTDYVDPSGYVLQGPTYALDFNLAVTGTDSPNRHHITVLKSTCIRRTGETQVQVGYENVLDENSRRYLGAVSLSTTLPNGSGSSILQASKVLDGETRNMGRLWLAPGRHRVVVYENGGQPIHMAPTVYVPPRCGVRVVPLPARPKVSIRQYGPRRVVVRVSPGGRVTRVNLYIRRPGRDYSNTFYVGTERAQRRVLGPRQGVKPRRTLRVNYTVWVRHPDGIHLKREVRTIRYWIRRGGGPGS